MYITVRMLMLTREARPSRPLLYRRVASIVITVSYCTLYIRNVYIGTLQFCTVRSIPGRAVRGTTHIIPHIRDLCTPLTRKSIELTKTVGILGKRSKRVYDATYQ